MNDQSNEIILIELLKLVQDLNASVQNFEKELHAIKKSVDELDKKFETMIKDSFPNGDIKSHKSWHERNFFTKLFR